MRSSLVSNPASPSAQSESPSVVSSHEGAFVAAFLLAFLAANLLTATRYPFPWNDECDIAEPAVSFLHGHGFVLRFSEILSMYSFLLVPWMKLFGATLLALRAASIVSVAAALAVLWSAVRRLGLVESAPSRLFLLLLLSTEYAMIFAYRDGRYDGFGALLMALALWILSIRNRHARLAALAVFSLFLAWAGLQFLPVVFAAGLVFFLFQRSKYLQEIAVSWIASAVGAALFLFSIRAGGRLPAFLKFLHAQPSGPTILANWLHHRGFHQANYIPKDFSLPFLAAAALLLFLFLPRPRAEKSRALLAFTLVFSVILTVVMLAAAKLPTYYCYLLAIPLSVTIASALAALQPRWLRGAVLGLCALSALAGAGLNLAVCLSDWGDRDYARVQEFIARSVQPTDIGYVDSEGYLAARNIALDVYLPEIAGGDILDQLSLEQKDSITVLVIRPEDTARVLAAFGSRWKPTGQQRAPTERLLFAGRNMGFLSLKPVDLVVYRKSG
jgi:MFS family permease